MITVLGAVLGGAIGIVQGINRICNKFNLGGTTDDS